MEASDPNHQPRQTVNYCRGRNEGGNFNYLSLKVKDKLKFLLTPSKCTDAGTQEQMMKRRLKVHSPLTLVTYFSI